MAETTHVTDPSTVEWPPIAQAAEKALAARGQHGELLAKDPKYRRIYIMLSVAEAALSWHRDPGDFATCEDYLCFLGVTENLVSSGFFKALVSSPGDEVGATYERLVEALDLHGRELLPDDYIPQAARFVRITDNPSKEKPQSSREKIERAFLSALPNRTLITLTRPPRYNPKGGTQYAVLLDRYEDDPDMHATWEAAFYHMLSQLRDHPLTRDEHAAVQKLETGLTPWAL